MIGTILVSAVAIASFVYAALMAFAYYGFSKAKTTTYYEVISIANQQAIATRVGLGAFFIFVLCILWLGI